MTYAGPIGTELREMLARQRAEHGRQVLFMRACRLSGNQRGVAKAADRAHLAWMQIRWLKGCERRLASGAR